MAKENENDKRHEEIHDTLIAISVVAKKLAQKINGKSEKNDKGD